MVDSKTRQLVKKLLQEVGKAHHRQFRQQAGVDPDWASWYARWLVEHSNLAKALDVKLVVGELASLLAGLDKEYRTSKSGHEGWEEFYAAKMVDHFAQKH